MPLVKSLMRENRRNLLHPRAAQSIPSGSEAQKLRRELDCGRSDGGVLLSAQGYHTRIAKLKAYGNSVAARYRKATQDCVDAAEAKYKKVLREELAGASGDPVLKAIRDKPATSWLQVQVADWLARRDGDDRISKFDPVCEQITHYKRTGKYARFAFKCYLRSHKRRRSPVACFWVNYLDVVNLPSANALLKKYGWIMADYLKEFSDGETPWDDKNGTPSSCNEWDLPPERRYKARKARRGSEHRLVKRRRIM